MIVTSLQMAPNASIVDLYDAVYGSLERANNKLQCTSIAITRHHPIRWLVRQGLPAISSGIFRFPLDICATVIIEAIEAAVTTLNNLILKDIRIVIIDDPTYKAFRKVFLAKFPGAVNHFPTCTYQIATSSPKLSKLHPDALKQAEAERKALAEAKEARRY